MTISREILAVIYARFSSEMQRTESIDSQLRLCREYAERKGYRVIAIFKDEAKTGTSDQRDGFQSMATQLMDGQLVADVVLAWKFDRLWRDDAAPGYWKYQLRQVGVRIESVALNLDRSNPWSIFMEGIDHAQAAVYSVNLAIETTRGQTQNATQARSAGGRPVLGYRLNEKFEYIIDERAAPAVQLIFAWYAAGKGYKAIIAELNARGHRTTRGRAFGNNSIHELLHNEKYIGIYEYRAWRRENAAKRSTGHMYEAEEQVIRIDGGVPAIVDRATWDAVQARLYANRKKRVGRKFGGTAVYLLSGRIYCGLCGSSLGGDSRTRRLKSGDMQKYHYYTCARRGREGCALAVAKREEVEGAVIAEIRTRLFSPAGIEEQAKNLAAWREEYEARRVDSARDFRARQVAITAEMERLVDGIARGALPVTDALGNRMRALEAERLTVEAELAALPAAPAPLPAAQLRRLIAKLEEKLLTADDRTQQAIIGQLVESVVVHPDKLDITLTLPNTNGDGIISRPREGIHGARDWNRDTPSPTYRLQVSVPRQVS